MAHFKLLIQEWIFEKRYGLQTSGFQRSDSEKHHHYQAAPYFVLHMLFQQIVPFTKGFAFYDIGCGKGRVLFLAALHGYKNLYGIELDGSLLQTANKNLSSKRLKTLDLHVQLIQQDVLAYDFENHQAVYFLFNPFDAGVLSRFIDRVNSSNQHECFVVYMNPIYSEVFTQKKIPVYRVIKTGFYTEAEVYRLKSCSRL